MKGRKPTPTRLKILQGNPGCRPLPPREPQVPTELPDPPDHLTGDAARVWDEVGAMLANVGIMTRLDVHSLAAYCELYARWVDANAKIRQHGILVKGKNDAPVPSPYFRISAITFDQMKSLLVEFGMTPSSRTRIQAAPPAKDENPFASVRRKK